MRINRHSGIGLNYPPFVHVFVSTLISSQSQSSLPSAAMEGENQQPPTQAAKPSKLKSKQTTLSVSQKADVVNATKSKLVGRVKEVSESEGTREH